MARADERRLKVLRAIVTDFVASHEPVGSKALVEKYQLGVSSATIRNDMAVLEAQGYITQPHPSSGRVPTEKGYREFVDNIEQIKPLSRAERTAIRRFLDESISIDDVLNRGIRLLSQLTQQVAVIQYPTLHRASVHHVEIMQMADRRVLIIIITDRGRVDQRIVEFERDLTPDAVTTLQQEFITALKGRTLSEASTAVAALLAEPHHLYSEELARAGHIILDTLVEHPEERLLLGGTSHLTRHAASFHGSLQELLDALEEQVVILKLLNSADTNPLGDPHAVTVRIGEETHLEHIHGTSVVSTTYGADDSVFGGLGVIGPTRMDYLTNIAAVSAVARYIGEILAGH